MNDFFVLAIKSAWNRGEDFGDMDLVFKLVDLWTQQLYKHLDICIQLFVPTEQWLKVPSLYTFDASWYQILVIIGKKRSRLSGWELKGSTKSHKQELQGVFCVV